MRSELVNEKLAIDMMAHAIQEMGYVSDFMPALYQEEMVKAGSPADEGKT